MSPTPLLSEASTSAVRCEIAEGRVPAIAFDTNCFFEGSKNVELDQAWVRRLKWLVASGHVMVMPDIWEREIQRNLQATIKDRSSPKLPVTMRGIDQELDAAMAALSARQQYVIRNSASIAARVLASFMKETAALRITAPPGGMERLLRMWHSGSPPFDVDNQRKKNEFPDALALLALEDFASQSGLKVIVVSRDGGCVTFCSQSQHLIPFDDAEAACDALKSRDEIERSQQWALQIAQLIHARRLAYLAALTPKLSDVLMSSLPEREYFLGYRMRTEIEATSAVDLRVGAGDELPKNDAIEFIGSSEQGEPPRQEVVFRHRISVDAALAFYVYATRPGEPTSWIRMGRQDLPTICQLAVNLLVRVPAEMLLSGNFDEAYFWLDAPVDVQPTFTVPSDWLPETLA